MTGWTLAPFRMRQRTGWTPARVTYVQLIALAAPVAVSLVERGLPQIVVLLAAAVTCLIWELAFDLIRGRSLGWHTATVALIFAVLVPASAPVWQIVVAVSLGVVFGELVFGGRGYGIVSGAAAAAGFLVFSFTGTELSSSSEIMALATLPALALLLVGGLVSWRVVVSVTIVLVGAVLVQDGVGGLLSAAVAVVFGLVFLIGDPVSGASTNSGRWVFGLLAGLLIVLFDTANGPAIAPAAVVFASLLASLFAPLIDHMAVALMVRRRRLRHG
ncbi:MAG: RnfABCDGE type electron transport complex subunit D [Hoeflea sp.]|uniref:RnfABCDGE type electron transport complex subunit D n=1 Tax=Hoeflea sp. TaxID=1940281 RepID=UPI003EF9C794